jgi:hypothetical protein
LGRILGKFRVDIKNYDEKLLPHVYTFNYQFIKVYEFFQHVTINVVKGDDKDHPYLIPILNGIRAMRSNIRYSI